MRKQDKLYTVNRWNSPLLCSGGRLFAIGGDTSAARWDKLASDTYGAKYGVEGGFTVDDYKNSKNSLGISKKNNPFSKGNIETTKTAGQAAAGLALNTSAGDKALDTFDPVYHLAGGRESSVGNGLNDAGKSLFKAGASSGNGWLMLAGAGAKVLGGLTNAAFGIKTDKTALNNINTKIDYNRNFVSNADNYDSLTPLTDYASYKKVYKGGWFSGGKARRKNAKLKAEYDSVSSFADRSITNNATNIADNQMGNALASYAAYGGPLAMMNNDMGATEYGMMSDYLTMKNNQAKNKGNMIGYLGNTGFGNNSTLFALGGDIQSNGADWTTGLGHIAAGGTHEDNPYQGVQMGIAPDGQPNLVEEGETIYNDYVFSDRLKPTKEVLKKFHLSTKNSKMTYADVSKKLEKESLERPNDPLSQAAFHKMLDQLAEAQEQQKAAEAAREAQAAFAAMSPEEQQQVMAQVAAQAQQEQLAQQQAAYDQQQAAGQEVPVDENGNPVEAPVQEQGYAYGGKLHRFGDGGKAAYANAFNRHTAQEWNDWALQNGLEGFDFDAITDLYQYAKDNPNFVAALGNDNPVIADVIRRGYDFGAYVPKVNNNLTFDFKHGGWGLETSNDWYGSTDAAWQELMSDPAKYGLDSNRLTKDNKNPYSSEEVGKALRQTSAYKKGTEWLRASEDNRLKYLQAIYNSPDAPQAARDYAGKYVDANGWLAKAPSRDYTAIFEDPNGGGVRNTHPGTYWKTPGEMLRGSEVTNYLKNADGSIVPLIGSTKDYKSIGSYSWDTPENRMQANYFEANPNAAPVNGTKPDDTTDPTDRMIPYKDDRLRYAGLLGPAIGLGLWGAGVGKPDTSELEASMNYARNATGRATYRPIGNYIKLDDMDIWEQQNRMDANTNATNRAIMNTGNTAGGKMAGLLSSGYNSQLGSADLYKKALESHNTNVLKEGEFNRGTDMFNAEAFNKTSQVNAELESKNAQFQANLAAEIAKQKMAARAQWYQGLYGNIGNLATGLSNLGRENAQHNMLAALANNDVFGTSGSEAGHYDGSKRAHGGKLKKGRRGFTV